ncbi:MAG: hypothetical protein GY839_11070 [candidate division Zixibacteria bacterium]|nr:hypothetical protein [candidate division Zixibacteria bacterium]
MSKKCFVVMSFKAEYGSVYHQAIKPAVTNCGYFCFRADDDPGPSNIPAQIIKAIISADIVIADLSELSPNVYYELGISHCIGNKTIAITSNLKNLPFDISVFRVTEYEINKNGLDHLALSLERAIKAYESSDSNEPNNLAQEAGRDYFDHRKKIEKKLTDIDNERSRILDFTEYNKLNGKLQDNSRVADKIVAEVSRCLPQVGEPLLICITGSGAIGKSTFSKLLAERIRLLHEDKISVDILPTDSYQLSRGERIHRNLIGFDPKSHELAKLIKDIESLLNGKEITVAPYDHRTGKHGIQKQIIPSDIIILEGVYSFFPPISPLSRGFKYYIYAPKHKAKELKFIADFKERGYDIQKAFAHAEDEYNAYETHILPFLRIADFVISVNQYWKYNDPSPQRRLPNPFIHQ